jgi:hypothetical protein
MYINKFQKAGVMVHAYNSNIWQMEAVGLQVQNQPEISWKTLS